MNCPLDHRRASPVSLPRYWYFGKLVLLFLVAACTDQVDSDEMATRASIPVVVESMQEPQQQYFAPWATAKDLKLDVGWNKSKPHGQLTYRAFVEDADLSPMYFVDQPFELNGHLLAYWETQFMEKGDTRFIDAKPEKKLRLRFYPQGPQMHSLLEDLSVLVEDSRKASRFFVYDEFIEDPAIGIQEGASEGQKLKIEAMLKPFGALPAKFESAREGYVAIPVTATLLDVLGFHDSASTFVYGKLSAVQPWPEGAPLAQDIPDLSDNEYLGRPWQQIFNLDSTAAAYVQPSEAARVVVPPRGRPMSVEKIATHNADWYLVRFLGDPDGKQGYVRTEDLWIVN